MSEPINDPRWHLDQAITEIRRLESQLRAAEEREGIKDAALLPFAEAAKLWDDVPGSTTLDDVQLWQRGRHVDYITCGDLRRARAALASAPTQGEPTKEPPRFGHELEHYNAYACKHCGLMTGYWPTLPECSVRFAQAYPLPEHLKEPTQGEGIRDAEDSPK